MKGWDLKVMHFHINPLLQTLYLNTKGSSFKIGGKGAETGSIFRFFWIGVGFISSVTISLLLSFSESLILSLKYQYFQLITEYFFLK